MSPISQLATFTEQLENDIIKQKYLLDNYVDQKDWRKAGMQQEYINGLQDALHMALAIYATTDRLENVIRRSR